MSLNVLPLMQFFEIADIMFMVNSLKNQSHRFNINKYVSIQNSNTRSSDKITLKHIRCGTYKEQHFYFNRIPRLWNKLPPLNLSLSTKSIKTKLYEIFWSHFQLHFDPNNSCTFHYLCSLCSSCSKLPLSHSLFS